MKMLAAILLATLVGTSLADESEDDGRCNETLGRFYPNDPFTDLYFECVFGVLELRSCEDDYNSEMCPVTPSPTSTPTSPPETTTNPPETMTSSPSTTADSPSSTGEECVSTTEENSCMFDRNHQQLPSPVDNKDRTVDSELKSQQPNACGGQYYNPYCLIFNAQSAPVPKPEVAINIYRNPVRENQINIAIY